MQTYELIVRNREVKGNSPDMTLVRSSVGIDQVHVLFDNQEWLGFPVTITFANKQVSVTQSLALTEIESQEWVAESTLLVPHEVIEMVGTIRVTIQGTDSQGRHIITAKGAPMAVEEAGDVDEGTLPSSVPTVDQWQQAYSDAVAAATDARSAAAMVASEFDSIIANAQASLQDVIDAVLHPATRESLGIVQVGRNLAITDDGVLSAVIPGYDEEEEGDEEPSVLTEEQQRLLYNLQVLAHFGFDTTFDEDGILESTLKVKPSALPVAKAHTIGAVRPDGATITVDENGRLSVPYVTHDWEGTTLVIRTAAGSSSADLVGPQGPPGEAGPPGPQGPSGYVLTNEDIELISEQIIEHYELGDLTRY